MPAAIDLTGRKFGLWTVREPCPEKLHGKRAWLCDCKCGTAKTVTGNDLVSGRVRSCGCLKGKKKVIDLTDRRFGRLTVLKLLAERRHGKALWRCRCDCGRITKVTSRSLISGNTTSCGCQHISKRAKAAFEAKKEIEDGGKKWRSPRYAAEVLGVHISVFSGNQKRAQPGWKERCLFRPDNAGIESKPFEVIDGFVVEYLSGEHVDEVKENMADMGRFPKVAGLVHFDDAAQAVGIHKRTLRNWLADAGVEVHKVKTRCPGTTQVRWKSYVPVSFDRRLLKHSAPTHGEPVIKHAPGRSNGVPSAEVEFPVYDERLHRLTVINGELLRQLIETQLESQRLLQQVAAQTEALGRIETQIKTNGNPGTTEASPVTGVERAIQIFLRDPSKSLREVARQAGCDPALLSRDERFRRLRASWTSEAPAKGTKSKNGDMEASSD